LLSLTTCPPSIDTPGVIQRVSRLFHGNPYLIQGFNTFLPLGYRIDISADPSDPNTITVTTPSGTTTQSTNNGSRPPHIPGASSHLNTPTFPGAIPVIPGLSGGPLSRSHTPHSLHLQGQGPPFDPTLPPGFQNPQTTAAASLLGNLNGNNRNPVERQPPGEFNHAIHYLNKIKARYSDDANTYKQFLDILQTYQKEQRHLQDVRDSSACFCLFGIDGFLAQSQVYVQVQLLFKDAPDLLAEFKDFLPEAVGAGPGQGGVVILPQPPGGPGSSTQSWPQPEPANSNPADKLVSQSMKKVPQPARRKKRVIEKDPTPVPPAKIAPSRVSKALTVFLRC
jgi:paired amphipathic helix protein Sin3a